MSIMIKVVFGKPLMNSIKLKINKAERVCKMHRHSNIKKGEDNIHWWSRC